MKNNPFSYFIEISSASQIKIDEVDGIHINLAKVMNLYILSFFLNIQ